MTLDEATKTELAARVEKLVASGTDVGLARKKVWNDHLAEQASSKPEPVVLRFAPGPEPPPSTRDGYQKRKDSGTTFFTPDRLAKSRSELAKIKQILEPTNG